MHFNGYSPALFAESERDLALSQCRSAQAFLLGGPNSLRAFFA